MRLSVLSNCDSSAPSWCRSIRMVPDMRACGMLRCAEPGGHCVQAWAQLCLGTWCASRLSSGSPAAPTPATCMSPPSRCARLTAPHPRHALHRLSPCSDASAAFNPCYLHVFTFMPAGYIASSYSVQKIQEFRLQHFMYILVELHVQRV